MRKKRSGSSPKERWLQLDRSFQAEVPQVASVFAAEDDFLSILIKHQDDGSCLAVIKRFGPDGAPMVAFGGGYGVAGALMALDATIAGNRWRVDKPWSSKRK